MPFDLSSKVLNAVTGSWISNPILVAIVVTLIITLIAYYIPPKGRVLKFFAITGIFVSGILFYFHRNIEQKFKRKATTINMNEIFEFTGGNAEMVAPTKKPDYGIFEEIKL